MLVPPAPKPPNPRPARGFLAFQGVVPIPVFENPPAYLVTPEELGDEQAAAAAAGVRRGTIRVWVSRAKIAPFLTDGDRALFHLPTVLRAQAASRPGRPRKQPHQQAA